jgi:hypothetical protein
VYSGSAAGIGPTPDKPLGRFAPDADLAQVSMKIALDVLPAWKTVSKGS